MDLAIRDCYTKEETNITTICSNSVDVDVCAKNYFKNHKTEFTKYKHVFKKNDTGYYWYSTEVV
ncbi:MAG: hypothetical protein NC483_00090 [Ruminococcus sp.]|nr:hypothetical protein [Ruminococcus sp.]